MTTNDLKKTAKDMGDNAVSSVRGMTGTVHDASTKFAGHARDAANQATDKAQELYGHARDRVQDAASHIPDTASEAWDTGHKAYRRGRKQLTKRVKNQPVEALLLAGAIGFLLGWATTR